MGEGNTGGNTKEIGREMSVEELKSILNQMDKFIKDLSKENSELKSQLAEMYNQLRNKSIDISFKVIELCEKNNLVSDYLDKAYFSAINIINYYLESIDPKINIDVEDDEKNNVNKIDFEEVIENDLSEENLKLIK